jgi:hypothetical protein
MNQDALERLRNKAKPTVENRDSSTIPALSNNQETTQAHESLTISRYTDSSNSSNQDFQISTLIDAEQSKPNPTAIADSNPLIKSSMDLKTKQSTVRLEQQLSQRLSELCLQQQVSREVFLEALFLYYENHKSIQSKVLQEARKRDQQRQTIANYRRAKSMIERFGLD